MTSDNGKYVSVKEAANKLNISERTIWKYIKRGILKTSRKFSSGKKPKVMVFESSVSDLLCERSVIDSVNNTEEFSKGSVIDHKIADANIPLSHYEEQRNLWLQERDQLQAGLMMYRYKFEETERRIKLLPAPPEIISSQFQEKEEVLKAEVEYRQQMSAVIHEQQAHIIQLEAELRVERIRPWWKKLIALK